MDSLPKPQVIRSQRRTMSLQITPHGELLVRAPLRASDWVVQRFMEQNKDWIEEHLQKVQTKPQVGKHRYQSGEKFWFLGKQVFLSIGDFKEIEIKGEVLFFPKMLEFRIQKELTDWYIRQARLLITQQVEHYSDEMKASYNDLTFSDTKSQWGRCTLDNRLQFSWRLVMAPLLVLNYVVIHELTHTFEKNHSRAFWSKVRTFTPSYRQQIKWLSENGHLLIV